MSIYIGDKPVSIDEARIRVIIKLDLNAGYFSDLHNDLYDRVAEYAEVDYASISLLRPEEEK